MSTTFNNALADGNADSAGNWSNGKPVSGDAAFCGTGGVPTSGTITAASFDYSINAPTGLVHPITFNVDRLILPTGEILYSTDPDAQLLADIAEVEAAAAFILPAAAPLGVAGTLALPDSSDVRLAVDRGDGIDGTLKVPVSPPTALAGPLSIKERIERLYVAILENVDAIGKVFRWDARGLRDPISGLAVDDQGQRLAMGHLDAMVIAGDESAQEGGMGDVGSTVKTMPVEVHLKIVLDDDAADSASYVHNAWLLALENAVLANPTMVDAQNVRLATDTRTTDTGQPPREEGQREMFTIIRFETQYEHNRDDAAAGPGIVHVDP